MDLQEQINDLKIEFAALQNSNAVPLNFDRAMRARFKFPSMTGIGTSNTQNLVVGGPGSFTIPAQPTGTIKVTIDGVDYQLLYQ